MGSMSGSSNSHSQRLNGLVGAGILVLFMLCSPPHARGGIQDIERWKKILLQEGFNYNTWGGVEYRTYGGEASELMADTEALKVVVKAALTTVPVEVTRSLSYDHESITAHTSLVAMEKHILLKKAIQVGVTRGGGSKHVPDKDPWGEFLSGVNQILKDLKKGKKLQHIVQFREKSGTGILSLLSMSKSEEQNSDFVNEHFPPSKVAKLTHNRVYHIFKLVIEDEE